MTRALLAALVVWCAAGGTAGAQPQAAPSASGLYESWSALRMAPVGPLAGAASPTGRWLRVVTQGARSTVTFEPDGRVVWRARWGPHGIVEKVTEVDGASFSRSTFHYDAAGRLQEKRVAGPGIRGGPWVFRYQTDATGRVTQRTSTQLHPLPWGTPHVANATAPAIWSVTYGGGSAVAEESVGGIVARRDRFDSAGRVIRTDFGTAQYAQSLVYRRDAAGTLLAVSRVRAASRGVQRPADPAVRDPSVTSQDLRPLATMTIERWEAALLLGSPATTRDEGRGHRRSIHDDWSGGCWMNEISALRWDATGLLAGTATPCICGFCVDAALAWHAVGEVEAIDAHWTAGPWVRLDGEVDVTADHEVMTPGGPRAAGELRGGDVVSAAGGGARVLRRVERLPRGPERLGRNVRTRSGTFEAGGFVFASEQPRACP